MSKKTEVVEAALKKLRKMVEEFNDKPIKEGKIMKYKDPQSGPVRTAMICPFCRSVFEVTKDFPGKALLKEMKRKITPKERERLRDYLRITEPSNR